MSYTFCVYTNCPSTLLQWINSYPISLLHDNGSSKHNYALIAHARFLRDV